MQTLTDHHFSLLLLLLKAKGTLNDNEIDWIVRAGEVVAHFGNGNFADIDSNDLSTIALNASLGGFGAYATANPPEVVIP